MSISSTKDMLKIFDLAVETHTAAPTVINLHDLYGEFDSLLNDCVASALKSLILKVSDAANCAVDDVRIDKDNGIYVEGVCVGSIHHTWDYVKNQITLKVK